MVEYRPVVFSGLFPRGLQHMAVEKGPWKGLKKRGLDAAVKLQTKSLELAKWRGNGEHHTLRTCLFKKPSNINQCLHHHLGRLSNELFFTPHFFNIVFLIIANAKSNFDKVVPTTLFTLWVMSAQHQHTVLHFWFTAQIPYSSPCVAFQANWSRLMGFLKRCRLCCMMWRPALIYRTKPATLTRQLLVGPFACPSFLAGVWDRVL